ncbi:unnamed protein product [Ostreobium quekettii]|uniref:U-box domain-containing protein n=1 Tax=Ostreobium quekettii TaxID=121088 RepID=A0A8S1JES7_9CHLO|nr:unnamed protein product [Ostreobium quekettii]
MELVTAVRETLLMIYAIRNHRVIVRRNVHHCQQLRQYVRSLEPVVQSMEAAADEPEVQTAFSRLLTTLKSAESLIEKTEAMGVVSSFVNARSITEEFSSVCARLSEAVQGLQLAQSTVGGRELLEMRQGMRNLADALKEAQSQALGKHQLPVHQKMRMILDWINSGTVAADSGRQMLHVLLEDAVGKAQLEAERQQSLHDIATRLEACRRQTDSTEKFDLLHIEAALGSQTSSSGDSREPPAGFVCPISLGVMQKPVLIPETGVSYEAESIEEWFRRGETTCPKTNLKLSSTSLVRNYALQTAIHEWKSWQGDAKDECDEDGDSETERHHTARSQPRALGRRNTEKIPTAWTKRDEVEIRRAHSDRGPVAHHTHIDVEMRAATRAFAVLCNIAKAISTIREMVECMGERVGRKDVGPETKILWTRLLTFAFPQAEKHLKDALATGSAGKDLQSCLGSCWGVQCRFLEALQGHAGMRDLDDVKRLKLAMDQQGRLLRMLGCRAHHASERSGHEILARRKKLDSRNGVQDPPGPPNDSKPLPRRGNPFREAAVLEELKDNVAIVSALVEDLCRCEAFGRLDMELQVKLESHLQFVVPNLEELVEWCMEGGGRLQRAHAGFSKCYRQEDVLVDALLQDELMGYEEGVLQLSEAINQQESLLKKLKVALR